MTVGFDPRTASIAFSAKPLAINPTVAPQSPHTISSLDDFLDDLRILIEGNKAWFASTPIRSTCAYSGGGLGAAGLFSDEAEEP